MGRSPLLLLALPVLFLGVGRCAAETVDIVEPRKLPSSLCANGCAEWADLAKGGNNGNQTEANLLWRSRDVQMSASRSCAQPAHSDFTNGTDVSGHSGAYCFCANGGTGQTPVKAYCRSADLVPEQINLQVSATDVIVAAFVTFGSLPNASAPCVAQFSTTNGSMADVPKTAGVTHAYFSPAMDNNVPQPVRPYNMHFVAMTNLAPRTKYFYRLAAADQGDQTIWSEVFSFHSLYGRGETKIALFGDMGMMTDGNTVHGNLMRLVEDGSVDALVHMGDHAYQMSSDDDRRGDGYMNAYQPLLSQLPWLPVMGNHEAYDNAFFHRFLNQSFGVQLTKGATPAPFCGHDTGRCATHEELALRHPTLGEEESISSDSALGTLLTRAGVVARGAKGTVPSHTSRWFSVDIGLVHIIALDLMAYPGATPDCVHPYGECKWDGVYQKAQKKWLREDLAAVDREATPWIIATAHHPMYCSSVSMGVGTSEFGEDGPERAMPAEPFALPELLQARMPKGKSYSGCWTGAFFQNAVRDDLEPLFLEYGVDMFLAGHEHDYESVWPVKHCSSPLNTSCYIGDSFDSPKAPVHVTCGEGGTNGGDSFGNNAGPWTRKQLGQDTPGECITLSSGGPTQGGCSAGFGVLTAHNRTHMTYQYVLNVNGTVWDEFTIFQPKHGPFED